MNIVPAQHWSQKTSTGSWEKFEDLKVCLLLFSLTNKNIFMGI